MKKGFSKEVKIGIAFVVCIFVLYYGINFLKGINIFKPANSYLVVFDDVTDLTLSTPVSINGFQIGLVHSMELDANNKIVATINLNKGVKIAKDSRVKLDVSMLGNATILIEENPVKNSFYSPGDTLYGERVKGLMDAGADLVPQIAILLPKIDSIMSSLQIIAGNPAIARSLENMEAITANLASSSADLSSFMKKDLPRLSNTMGSIASNVDGVTKKFNSMDLVSTYNSVDSTLKNVQHLSTKLLDKNNSLGLLLNDRQLYDSLNVTIGNASLLLQDVKENPKRYINLKVF